MTINGISGANTQTGQLGMNRQQILTAKIFRTRLQMRRSSYRSFLLMRI